MPDKVVLRYKDGDLLKGYLRGFSDTARSLSLETLEGRATDVKIDALKAIFFVRTFEGNRNHKEKKSFEDEHSRGTKVYVRFTDGESIIGYRLDKPSRKKGFFLTSDFGEKTGFFIMPVDEDSNNLRVFVFYHALKDVASIG